MKNLLGVAIKADKVDDEDKENAVVVKETNEILNATIPGVVRDGFMKGLKGIPPGNPNEVSDDDRADYIMSYVIGMKARDVEDNEIN